MVQAHDWLSRVMVASMAEEAAEQEQEQGDPQKVRQAQPEACVRTLLENLANVVSLGV